VNTHNAVCVTIADRIIHLSDGKITSDRKNDRRVSPAELSW
jgi:putative ABC transport system ATP-binding protein